MSKYVICYNPYKNMVIVEKNGSKLRKNCDICKGLNEKRLQNWFDETVGWPGLGKMIDDDNNESTCEIIFKGREIDFIDLRDYFKNIYVSMRNTEFKLSAESLSRDEDMLSKLSDLVDTAKEKNLFPANQITDIESHMYHLKNDPFVISVIATMSSGKSTLLNAIMHRELLPTGDKATTANIVEIYDDDSETVTYETFDNNGKIIQKGYNADISTFRKINLDSQVRTVKIYSDIPMVTVGKMSLMMRDTPGPNNSGDIRHRQITESIISNARDMSTVLYIMNALQLEVESDKDLLDDISIELKNGGKQANDRFLFVINRVDDWIKKKEQTLDGLLESARTYLKGFGIDNPRIFLLTAELASNIWKKRNGFEFDDEEIEDLEKYISRFSQDKEKYRFDNKSSYSQCVRKLLDIDIEKALSESNLEELALIHSGFKGLEYSIKEYIEKYAYPIKVSDAIKDIVDSIDEKRMRTRFLDSIASDEYKLKKVQKKIEEGTKKKEERLKRKKEFEDKISEYVISEDVEKDAKGLAMDAFVELINKYKNQITGKSRLIQSEAYTIVGELQTKVNEKEIELDKKLKEIINKEVYDKGTLILEDYQNYIYGIEGDLDLDDFDFRKVKDLQKNSFDDIRKVADKVTSTETLYKETKETVKNPNYHRFLFWHWGGDKFIEKITKTPNGEIKYVDKSAFLEDLAEININAEKNVKALLEEAKALINEFKMFFSLQMDKFNSSIETVLEELNNEIENEKRESQNKIKHEKQLKELDEYMNMINSITDF